MTSPSPFIGFSPPLPPLPPRSPPPPRSNSYQYGDMFRVASFPALPASFDSSQFHALTRPSLQPHRVHPDISYQPHPYPPQQQQQVVYVLPYRAEYANGSLPHPPSRAISSSAYRYAAVPEESFAQPDLFHQQPLPPLTSPHPFTASSSSSSSSSTTWNNSSASLPMQLASNGYTHSVPLASRSPYPTAPAHAHWSHQPVVHHQQQANTHTDSRPNTAAGSMASPAPGPPDCQTSWRRVIAGKKKSGQMTVRKEQHPLVMAENATFELELTAVLPTSSCPESSDRIDLNESDTVLTLRLSSEYAANKRPLARSAWTRCQHLFHMEARGMLGFNASDMAVPPMPVACSKRTASLRRRAEQTFRDVRSDDESATTRCRAGELALVRQEDGWHLHSVREPESQHGRTSGGHCIPLSLQVRSDYWKATYTGARHHRPRAVFTVALLFPLDGGQRRAEWSIPLDVRKSDGISRSSSSSSKKRKRPQSRQSDNDSPSDEGEEEEDEDAVEDEDEDEGEGEDADGQEGEEEQKQQDGPGTSEQALPYDANAMPPLAEAWPLSPTTLPVSPSWLTAYSPAAGTYMP